MQICGQPLPDYCLLQRDSKGDGRPRVQAARYKRATQPVKGTINPPHPGSGQFQPDHLPVKAQTNTRGMILRTWIPFFKNYPWLLEPTAPLLEV